MVGTAYAGVSSDEVTFSRHVSKLRGADFRPYFFLFVQPQLAVFSGSSLGHKVMGTLRK